VTLAFKILYRSYRTVAGLRHWGYRRFTSAGMTVLAGLVIGVVLGPDTDNNVAYQGFAFLLLLLVLACGSSFFFPRSFFSPPRPAQVRHGGRTAYLYRLVVQSHSKNSNGPGGA